MKRFDSFTYEELSELSSGLGWAENEGGGSDLMNKLNDEIYDSLHKRNQTKQSQPKVEAEKK